MSKFIQIHFFYPSIFPLQIKQKRKEIKIKSFTYSHFFTPSTHQTLKSLQKRKILRDEFF